MGLKQKKTKRSINDLVHIIVLLAIDHPWLLICTIFNSFFVFFLKSFLYRISIGLHLVAIKIYLSSANELILRKGINSFSFLQIYVLICYLFKKFWMGPNRFWVVLAHPFLPVAPPINDIFCHQCETKHQWSHSLSHS